MFRVTYTRRGMVGHFDLSTEADAEAFVQWGEDEAAFTQAEITEVPR